jgi:polyisoprenoid-binding protein YceI
MGTAAGMSLPSASAPVNKKTSASATTTTLSEYYSLSRVLTFDHAGLGQCSFSSRRFGLLLRGRSGLLGGQHGFFVRHHCRGFIPLPRQIL